MKIARILAAVLLVCASMSVVHAEEENVAAFEQRLSEAVSGKGVTVVHLWATWCPNCWNEHDDNGWKNFIEANPEVKVIFVSIWGSKEHDHAELAKYDLGEQSNLEIWRHPNQARRGSERMVTLLGKEVTWIPTTWVYREGKQRFAINYGEVRFDMLQQMVDDSRPGQW
ncbi:TlpA family protein disulfide reductase [Actomonas aquatica]|uniref:Thioredoxin family protein n=1 Tax=Actomonas aquatica TaxID=2866162 RepID=A0ABZ1CEU3_9BACT|nr:thioredoxin family protein [Opitutus sp. WL0086]WRQ90018.1 thioredoxin family protein [Opitutus sp. WL0086]